MVKSLGARQEPAVPQQRAREPAGEHVPFAGHRLEAGQRGDDLDLDGGRVVRAPCPGIDHAAPSGRDGATAGRLTRTPLSFARSRNWATHPMARSGRVRQSVTRTLACSSPAHMYL